MGVIDFDQRRAKTEIDLGRERRLLIVCLSGGLRSCGSYVRAGGVGRGLGSHGRGCKGGGGGGRREAR